MNSVKGFLSTIVGLSSFIAFIAMLPTGLILTLFFENYRNGSGSLVIAWVAYGLWQSLSNDVSKEGGE